MEQNTVYRHMTTGNKFETNKFLVHGQRLNGSWQKLQILALFCWLGDLPCDQSSFHKKWLWPAENIS